MNTKRSIQAVAFIATLLLVLFAGLGVRAERGIEWLNDDLWVIDSERGEFRFEPLVADFEQSVWSPRVAALSPDGEWVAFVRHTGGGFEDEGQSCFVATWDGQNERLLLSTDKTVPAVYWLEANGRMFVAVQQMSGGTAFRSSFSVVDFASGEVRATVEGRIYGTSLSGTRASSSYPGSAVGVKYEVLGQNEEPSRWGVFYVDELIDFGPSAGIDEINGESAGDSPACDGKTSTAWLGASGLIPSLTITFAKDVHPTGVFIMAGWAWHWPPSAEELPWEGLDCYELYDRPKSLLLEFPDGSRSNVELEDTRCPQWISFPEAVDASGVVVSIESVYRGIKFEDVAVSEIYLP